MFSSNFPIYKGLRQVLVSLYYLLLKKILNVSARFSEKILPLGNFFNQSGYLRKATDLWLAEKRV